MPNDQPTAQIVSQVLLNLPSPEPAQTFQEARAESLKWAHNRAGVTLPSGAWWGHQFHLMGITAQPVAAVPLGDDFWALRVDDADRQTAQRTWITEIGVAIAETGVTFGCRLYCRTLGENVPFSPSIPGVVRQIVDNLRPTIDGRNIQASAWRVHDEDSVRQLVDFLTEPTRQRSVIVVASPPDGQRYSVDPDLLARSLLGVSHVVTIGQDASFILSDSVGREFSVFDGAVRTYQTGFYPDADQPSSHPLALGSKIEESPGSFFEFLVRRSMRTFLASRNLLGELPSFASVRAQAAKNELDRIRKEGASDSQLLELALEENRQLQQRLSEQGQLYDGILLDADREIKTLESKLEEVRERNFSLRNTNGSLITALSKSEDRRVDPIPDSLDEIQAWCLNNLGDSVVMLNRAFRGLKESAFEDDVALIYGSLLLLRDHYVPMRRKGTAECRTSFESACQALGIEESESISRTRAGEEGDLYFVKHSGQNMFLDRHLKKGNSRDPRHCFRLYFSWDSEDEVVVVGWLPSHLDIRST